MEGRGTIIAMTNAEKLLHTEPRFLISSNSSESNNIPTVTPYVAQHAPKISSKSKYGLSLLNAYKTALNLEKLVNIASIANIASPAYITNPEAVASLAFLGDFGSLFHPDTYPISEDSFDESVAYQGSVASAGATIMLPAGSASVTGLVEPPVPDVGSGFVESPESSVGPGPVTTPESVAVPDVIELPEPVTPTSGAILSTTESLPSSENTESARPTEVPITTVSAGAPTTPESVVVSGSVELSQLVTSTPGGTLSTPESIPFAPSFEIIEVPGPTEDATTLEPTEVPIEPTGAPTIPPFCEDDPNPTISVNVPTTTSCTYILLKEFCVKFIILFYRIGVSDFESCGQVTSGYTGSFSVVFQQRGASARRRGSVVYIGILPPCSYTKIALYCGVIPQNYIVLTVSPYIYPGAFLPRKIL